MSVPADSTISIISPAVRVLVARLWLFDDICEALDRVAASEGTGHLPSFGLDQQADLESLAKIPAATRRMFEAGNPAMPMEDASLFRQILIGLMLGCSARSADVAAVLHAASYCRSADALREAVRRIANRLFEPSGTTLDMVTSWRKAPGDASA